MSMITNMIFGKSSKKVVSSALDSKPGDGEDPDPPQPVLNGNADRRELAFLRYSQNYDCVWNDKRTGARNNASIWRPRIPSDTPTSVYYLLGDTIVEEYDAPRSAAAFLQVTGMGVVARVNVKNQWVKRSAEHARAEKRLSALLAAPAGYKLVFQSDSTFKHPLYIWAPVPPSGDYVALGQFATSSLTAPSVDVTRCVHKSIVTPLPSDILPCVWNWKNQVSAFASTPLNLLFGFSARLQEERKSTSDSAAITRIPTSTDDPFCFDFLRETIDYSQAYVLTERWPGDWGAEPQLVVSHESKGSDYSTSTNTTTTDPRQRSGAVARVPDFRQFTRQSGGAEPQEFPERGQRLWQCSVRDRQSLWGVHRAFAMQCFATAHVEEIKKNVGGTVPKLIALQVEKMVTSLAVDVDKRLETLLEDSQAETLLTALTRSDTPVKPSAVLEAMGNDFLAVLSSSLISRIRRHLRSGRFGERMLSLFTSFGVYLLGMPPVQWPLSVFDDLLQRRAGMHEPAPEAPFPIETVHALCRSMHAIVTEPAAELTKQAFQAASCMVRLAIRGSLGDRGPGLLAVLEALILDADVSILTQRYVRTQELVKTYCLSTFSMMFPAINVQRLVSVNWKGQGALDGCALCNDTGHPWSTDAPDTPSDLDDTLETPLGAERGSLLHQIAVEDYREHATHLAQNACPGCHGCPCSGCSYARQIPCVSVPEWVSRQVRHRRADLLAPGSCGYGRGVIPPRSQGPSRLHRGISFPVKVLVDGSIGGNMSTSGMRPMFAVNVGVTSSQLEKRRLQSQQQQLFCYASGLPVVVPQSTLSGEDGGQSLTQHASSTQPSTAISKPGRQGSGDDIEEYARFVSHVISQKYTLVVFEACAPHRHASTRAQRFTPGQFVSWLPDIDYAGGSRRSGGEMELGDVTQECARRGFPPPKWEMPDSADDSSDLGNESKGTDARSTHGQGKRVPYDALPYYLAVRGAGPLQWKAGWLCTPWLLPRRGAGLEDNIPQSPAVDTFLNEDAGVFGLYDRRGGSDSGLPSDLEAALESDRYRLVWTFVLPQHDLLPVPPDAGESKDGRKGGKHRVRLNNDRAPSAETERQQPMPAPATKKPKILQLEVRLNDEHSYVGGPVIVQPGQVRYVRLSTFWCKPGQFAPLRSKRTGKPTGKSAVSSGVAKSATADHSSQSIAVMPAPSRKSRPLPAKPSFPQEPEVLSGLPSRSNNVSVTAVLGRPSVSEPAPATTSRKQPPPPTSRPKVPSKAPPARVLPPRRNTPMSPKKPAPPVPKKRSKTWDCESCHNTNPSYLNNCSNCGGAADIFQD